MDEINEFIEWQLAQWPEAKARYDALRHTRRRAVSLGQLTAGVQCNPARMVSTGAKIDDASLAKRPCFLCEANRPAQQEGVPIEEGWQLLLNPFPIFPVHFTIASTRHQPQAHVPAEIASIAEKLPGLTIFYNGSRAGASAPDHLHLQAVLTAELPLMQLAMRLHPSGAHRQKDVQTALEPIKLFTPTEDDIPFAFYSAIITPDMEGMETLVRTLEITGTDPQTGLADSGLVNAYFWIDPATTLLRAVMVPRIAHRPACYSAEGDAQRLVSPGAIDMAGVIITPRPEDYERLTPSEIRTIYSQVAG